MSANVVRVSGDYKIQTVQGGTISLDTGSVSGTVTVVGNLNVNGTTTSLITTNTSITDNILVINKESNPVHNGVTLGISGIEIDRGTLSNAQLLFDESLSFDDPVTSTSKRGLFVFKTADGSVNGIRTNSIDTNGGTLNLINSGTGVISVKGTSNYENYVTDDDHIPNKKYLADYVDFRTGVASKLILTQPAHTATLTIDDYKIFRVENTLTFTGTDSSTIAFSTGGTVTYTSNKLNVFSSTSSSELSSIISDETGSGSLVFSISPTLTTPTLGNAIATTINNITFTEPLHSATLTIADNKTLTVSNTLTLTGTDGSTLNFGSGGTFAYTSNKLSVFSATSSSELAGVISDETGTGLLVFNNSPTIAGHPTIEGITSTGATGTGKFVFDGSPTLVTPTLGAATATTINKLTITTPASGSTLTIDNGKTLRISNTLTFTGTDTSSVEFSTGGTVTYTSNKLNVFSATSSSELAGIISDETGTGLLVFNNSPTISGHPTVEGVTSTGATGTGKFVFDNAPTISGHPTIEGVTSTGATGTGNLVFSASTTFTGTTAIATLNLTNALGIAYGGTNQTSYTSPSSSINPIVYYDGTRLQTNTSAADIGYNSSTDNFFTRNITTVSLSAQSTTGGSLVQIQTDPGAAMISGNRLGGIFFGGSTNNTHTIQNRASIETFATQSWTITNQGAKIVFSTTPNNTNSRVTALTLDQDQSATFAGHVTVEGVTSTGATGTGKFVFDTAPTISGHLTVEGVTSTGATGTGKFVFDGSPTLVTPNIGAATATTINGLTISTSTGTLTIANSKIVTVNNTLTFTGTDTSSVDFGAGGTVTYTRNKLSVFSSTSSSELASVISDETGTGLLVFGTSPTISTSIITDSTSFNLINTTATTVNFAGAATTINVGATTGKITINSTDNSTSKTSGALVVSGGVGVANDLYLGGNATLLYQATDPTANSGGVKVYSKNSNLGNTGIYYVNNTTSGELVSKKKALAYSIVFG